MKEEILNVSDGFTTTQIKDFEKSGIDVITAIACGIHNEPDQNRLREILRWGGDPHLGPSLVLPYYPGGRTSAQPAHHRVKPDTPYDDGDGIRKYLQPKGVSTSIYFPPTMDHKKLDEVETPLYLTEGEKKAIALTDRGFLSLSAPGVWNFHDPNSDKNDRKLKSCFDEVHLRDRDVYIVFDLMEFKKNGVLGAKIALAEMLYQRGAKPKLVHLSDDPDARTATSDLGVDDYLCLYGTEKFVNVVLNSAWEYPISMQLLKFSSDVSRNWEGQTLQKIIAYLSLTKDILERKEIILRLQKHFGLGKREILSLEKERGRGQMPRKQRQGGRGQQHLINWGSERPFNERCNELTDNILDTRKGFRIGNIPVFISKNDKICFIGNGDAFRGFISENIEFYTEDELRGCKYLSPPHSDIDTILNRPTYIDRLPEICTNIDHPAYDEFFEPYAMGYNQLDRVYLQQHSVTPRTELHHVTKLLESASYAQDGSKVNRLGGWLSCLFPIILRGNKPLALYQGNQRGLGKSWGAETDAIIRSGKLPITISYKPDDDELEKQLAAATLSGGSEILLDNAKVSMRCPEISSGVLERSITGSDLNFRILGSSKFVTRSNTGYFALTANNPKLGSDLISRSMSINYYCEGDPAHRVFSIDDPREYALEHRNEILGELVGMVEKWKKAGRPLCKVKYRFQKFAQIIGGVLEANGFSGFLSNTSATSESLSSEYDDLLDLINAHPMIKGKAKNFVEKALQMGLFQGEFAGKKGTGLYRAMANILSRYVGKLFQLENGGAVELVSKPNSSTKNLEFALIAVMDDVALQSPQQIDMESGETSKPCGDVELSSQASHSVQEDKSKGENDHSGDAVMKPDFPIKKIIIDEEDTLQCGDTVRNEASPQGSLRHEPSDITAVNGNGGDTVITIGDWVEKKLSPPKRNNIYMKGGHGEESPQSPQSSRMHEDGSPSVHDGAGGAGVDSEIRPKIASGISSPIKTAGGNSLPWNRG